MLITRFRHLVPYDRKAEQTGTFFQGFTLPAVGLTPIIDCILKTPPDLAELCMTYQDAIALRIGGYYGYNIFFVPFDIVDSLPMRQDMPFIIIHSDAASFEWVSAWVARSQQPILHVSSVEREGAILRSVFDRTVLREFSRKVQLYVNKTANASDISLLDKLLNRERDEPPPLDRRFHCNHEANRPNELTLRSMGYSFPKYPELAALKTRPKHVGDLEADSDIYDCIAKWARMIARLRSQAKSREASAPNATIDLVLIAPTFFRDHYRSRGKLPLGVSKEFEDADRMIRLLIKQKTMRMTAAPGLLAKLWSSRGGQAVLEVRRQEIHAFSRAAAVKAAASFAPTLRLGPGINLVRAELKKIGDTARGIGPHRRWKIGKLVSNLVAKMAGCFPREYLEFLEPDNLSVKIVSDVPLEWLRLGPLPLCLKHQTTRIPSTPGQLTVKACLQNESRHSVINAAMKIIAVRTLQQRDPLYRVFEQVLRKRELLHRIDFVDVKTVDELRATLSTKPYDVLIFDGHGSHPERTESGGLHIGDDLIDQLQVLQSAQIPPFVIRVFRESSGRF